MIRRRPTRLELKLEDLEEFEAVKKEIEARRERLDTSAGGAETPTTSRDARQKSFNERIGYNPLPKAAAPLDSTL
ncbi:anaphase-promoting complex subunit CDC26 [Lethenteron reissneri]|uniref:anaphase-promoting complex subunit CDC26 n=1 Tax=Lethenteron reissneri TaxID=7753 RepID=UPI002AB67A28|nr:anaphase-promoting complex subunit CDC26 [Lethenteron reissneri]